MNLPYAAKPADYAIAVLSEKQSQIPAIEPKAERYRRDSCSPSNIGESGDDDADHARMVPDGTRPATQELPSRAADSDVESGAESAGAEGRKGEGGRGRAEGGNSCEELTAKARRTQRQDRKTVDKKMRREMRSIFLSQTSCPIAPQPRPSTPKRSEGTLMGTNQH